MTLLEAYKQEYVDGKINTEQLETRLAFALNAEGSTDVDVQVQAEIERLRTGARIAV